MYETITANDLAQLLTSQPLQILDVREGYEFFGGHLPCAQNMPLSELASDYQKLTRDQHYYVICHSGNRSDSACQLLARRGYQVTNIMGGMAMWKGDVTQ